MDAPDASSALKERHPTTAERGRRALADLPFGGRSLKTWCVTGHPLDLSCEVMIDG
jgi:hypothetical protein